MRGGRKRAGVCVHECVRARMRHWAACPRARVRERVSACVTRECERELARKTRVNREHIRMPLPIGLPINAAISEGPSPGLREALYSQFLGL